MNYTKLLTTESELRAVPVQSTRTYTAIPHGKVIDDVRYFTLKAGFRILEETYKQCNFGAIAQGEYRIQHIDDEDMGLQMIWQNSTNKQVSFKFALGAQVFICGNGMVFGDQGAFKRKHKGIADIFTYNKMEEIIGNSGEAFENMISVKEQLKGIELSRELQSSFLGQLYAQEEVLSISQVKIVKDQMDEPSFDYGTAQNNAWTFMQHCTHSFKEITPRVYLPKQIELTNFFQEKVL
jgi:hypothetical protein